MAKQWKCHAEGCERKTTRRERRDVGGTRKAVPVCPDHEAIRDARELARRDAVESQRRQAIGAARTVTADARNAATGGMTLSAVARERYRVAVSRLAVETLDSAQLAAWDRIAQSRYPMAWEAESARVRMLEGFCSAMVRHALASGIRSPRAAVASVPADARARMLAQASASGHGLAESQRVEGYAPMGMGDAAEGASASDALETVETVRMLAQRVATYADGALAADALALAQSVETMGADDALAVWETMVARIAADAAARDALASAYA